MTIWRMRIAWWMSKATNTYSGCVILIAFPQQQWLHKPASMLRYTYYARLVTFLVTMNLSFKDVTHIFFHKHDRRPMHLATIKP